MSNQSQISDSIDHAYFTSEEDAQFVTNKLLEFGWLNSTILEPSCGAGALVKPLKKLGIKPDCSDLIDYGVGASIENYLESSHKHYDLVLTNPPFGKMAKLAIQFFNKAATHTDHIAFIVPQSFRKVSIIDRLDRFYWPVLDEDLPSQVYILPDGSKRKVRTCFQMWERRVTPREKISSIDHSCFFQTLTKKEALETDGAYALRGQGSSAGKVLKGLDHSESSTRFLVGSKDIFQRIDLSRVASFTAGIPSIGFSELALAASLEKSIKQKDFLAKGVISLLMASHDF